MPSDQDEARANAPNAITKTEWSPVIFSHCAFVRTTSLSKVWHSFYRDAPKNNVENQIPMSYAFRRYRASSSDNHNPQTILYNI